MQLRQLLDQAEGRPGIAGASLLGDPTTEVGHVTMDSRDAIAGTLFCCVPGALTDGHDHAPAAVAAGAVALLCERPLDLGVAQVVVPSVRAALGSVSSVFHGDPSRAVTVVGVTGTNGKTTVTHLVAAILDAAGRPCDLIGTLSGARTTPEAPELQARLARARDQGRAAVAMEVSSHALHQGRVDGTWFEVVAFTNLSQDHLDYHGTMEAYFQAKADLFHPGRAARAVVCTDDAHGRLLVDAALLPTVGYSGEDATDVAHTAKGTRFTWRGQPMEVALAGRFNLLNAVGAATIAAELGVATDTIARGLAAVAPVPGRFELVDAGQSHLVVVDYAHTPDGLSQALFAARDLAGQGRVIVVFGAGGDRDHAKRPQMGEAAMAGADVVIVTSDNPRSEDPHAIIADVLSGFPADSPPLVEPDRRAAIALALDAAGPHDVVLIAGKGHETTQVIGTEALPFDDRVVARELLGAQQ